MFESSVERKFLYPRSYVGRAILFLFASPFVAIALRWVYAFISHLIGGGYKLYCYGTGALEEARTEAYTYSSDMVIGFIMMYIRIFIIFLMECVFIYFDTLITMSIFAFIVWMFLRYTRNGAFGKLEWCRTFIGAAGIWFLVPVVSVTIYFCESDAYPSFWSFIIQDGTSFLYYAIRLAIFALAARALFINTPYEIDPIWKNEISAREFFSVNVKTLFGKIFRKSALKYYLIFFALDILMFCCKAL